MNVLLVSEDRDLSEKMTSVLTQWFEEREGVPFTIASAPSSVEGRHLAREEDYDVILLYTPLEGSLGDETAKQFASLSAATVVVITPEKVAARMREKFAGEGILLTTTPLRKHEFFSTLTAAAVCSERTRTLLEENAQLRAKLAEQKTIEQAKLLLVECLKLSEEQAHKYIEREAMELRTSRVEVARRIISTYRK